MKIPEGATKLAFTSISPLSYGLLYELEREKDNSTLEKIGGESVLSVGLPEKEAPRHKGISSEITTIH
jgi:hypothetical protein